MQAPEMDDPDFLIVGGGSAGAVLAARLSENPATRVLLVEAGRDTPPTAIPPDISDTFPSSSLNARYFWPGLKAIRSAGGSPHPFPQARIMGGGSSVMGLWALRGLPADFDGWSAAGAHGWAWTDVRSVFQRLENDSVRMRSDAKPGPMPITRVALDEWPPFAHALGRAAQRRGLAWIDDINEQPNDGFFAMPLSQDEAGRATSARCYLTGEVRRRVNLAIMTDTCVTVLNLTGNRVSSVTVQSEGGTKKLSARQFILCAGAIYSPALLLRSGIGPAQTLRNLGILPLVDRPGVGQNLQNHVYLQFALTVPQGFRLARHLRRFAIAGIRLSSGEPNSPKSDLLLYAIGRVSPRSYGPTLIMFGAALYSPFSRGQVTLDSSAADASPRIEFNMLTHPNDRSRLVKAARYGQMLLKDPEVVATYSDAFLLPPVMALSQFNRPGLLGVLVGMLAKGVLDAPPAIQRVIIGSFIQPGRWFANRHGEAILTDEEILSAAAPMAHPAGTCAFGPSSNPKAVLDANCRVYGVSNLRVVDASVMPILPSANTNLPTLMIAERAAEKIQAEAIAT